MEEPSNSGGMNSRQRFREVMAFGAPDRIPYFEEGLRDEVRDVWRDQGLAAGKNPDELFPTDYWDEIQPDLDPRPAMTRWPTTIKGLSDYTRRLDADDPDRLPAKWPENVRESPRDGRVKMLRVHRGFFLSMGIQAWLRFRELMDQVMDDPELVQSAMRIQGRFAARLADQILSQIQVDAAIFSEPIGGNHGPLISPHMYADLVLPSYQPLMAVLQKHGVATIICRTYANARILIPKMLDAGFNGLWACEVNHAAMDYRDLRREFGQDLRLIGGIDLDALRQGRAAIRKELTEKLPALTAQGGYIPLADGRIREDVRFEDYCYYRGLLQELTA